MEAARFLFAAGILSAAFSAYYFVRSICAAVPLHSDAAFIYASDIKTGSLAHVLRHGIPLLLPIAQGLLVLGIVRDTCEEGVKELDIKGYVTSVEALFSLALCVFFGVIVAGSIVSSSLLCGVAVGVCVCLIAGSWLRTQREKRMCAVRDSIPDTLRALEASLSSGFSLPQTLEQVSGEVQSELGTYFAKSAHVLQTGGSAAEALRCLRVNADISELAFVAVALDVQHQTGGSMKQILESARDMAENELELARLLRVQTAQARLSARVVSVLPFVLVALFSLISEDFLAPFFSSMTGLALLTLACGMQFAGIMSVRRILKVSGT